MQVSFDWRSFDTTRYWVVSVETLKLLSTDTQPSCHHILLWMLQIQVIARTIMVVVVMIDVVISE